MNINMCELFKNKGFPDYTYTGGCFNNKMLWLNKDNHLEDSRGIFFVDCHNLFDKRGYADGIRKFNLLDYYNL